MGCDSFNVVIFIFCCHAQMVRSNFHLFLFIWDFSEITLITNLSGASCRVIFHDTVNKVVNCSTFFKCLDEVLCVSLIFDNDTHLKRHWLPLPSWTLLGFVKSWQQCSSRDPQKSWHGHQWPVRLRNQLRSWRRRQEAFCHRRCCRPSTTWT